LPTSLNICSTDINCRNFHFTEQNCLAIGLEQPETAVKLMLAAQFLISTELGEQYCIVIDLDRNSSIPYHISGSADIIRS